VTGVRVDTATPDWQAALDALSTRDVQIVVLAETALNTTTGAVGGPWALLADHVVSVSNTGGHGMERIAVAMLAKGSADPTVVRFLVRDRAGPFVPATVSAGELLRRTLRVDCPHRGHRPDADLR
jgi:hypothetical protein